MGLGTDAQLRIDILEYQKKFNYDIIIETGTDSGTSSIGFSQMFKKVYTCDINEKIVDYVTDRFKDIPNITFMLGNSPDCLRKWFAEIGHDKFFLFLDAHWGGYWPLQDELQVVIDFGYKPFIFIHDFDCKQPNWAYDSYNDIPLDYDYVKDKMDKIYGDGKYVFEMSTKSQNLSTPTCPNNLRGCGWFYPI